MNSSIILRDYQQEMLSRLNKAWKRNRSVMVQMPTGTGKTVLLAEVINENIEIERLKNGKGCAGVLVVAHRRELIGQISQTLDSLGVEHGLIVSGKEIDCSRQVQVASIQTLTRRMNGKKFPGEGKNGKELPEIGKNYDNYDNFFPSLVIIDEAHHALAKTYRMLWDWWPEAKFLGLTATPCRLNGVAFTDLFDVLLQSYSIQEFIDKGWLSDFEYVSAAPNSEVMRQVRSLNKRGADGDYQLKELATVMDVPESIEHLYKTYRQFAGGRKGIVYAIDRRHAQHIAEYYREQGVRCAVIDAKTPAEERRRIIDGYRLRGPAPSLDGRGAPAQCIDVLVNVDIFSEGFDCPEVEFIQLARPTLSLSKYLQQVGRGMRVSKGKPHVLILDNVGLYQAFGLPTEERDWRQAFHGMVSGRGTTTSSRLVVLDEAGISNPLQRELVNLQMVRIKKGGRRSAGLEIFLQDGRYGVRNNGKVTCPARFKEIVRLRDPGGFFAAGIYGSRLYGDYVEYASLIDRKGVDLGLRLFRDVSWENGVYYSCYKPKGYQEGGWYWSAYWDPKGNCYYDCAPEFRMVAGVEVAEAYEHDGNQEHRCHKLRYSTGKLSPRFHLDDLYFNKHIIIARDYLVVKTDRNHAYHICGYLNDTVIVQKEDLSGFQQIFLDGKKGESFRKLPAGMTKITPVSYIYYQKDLGLQNLWRNN